MDDLHWLINWFECQCDGKWEQSHRISIGTLDNPGWSIKISIDKTVLENKQFKVIDVERSEEDWLYASIRDERFYIACGVNNLPEALHIFREWASNEYEGKSIVSRGKEGLFMEELNWLADWFDNECDGDWEHSYAVHIDTLDGAKWHLSVRIEETDLEDKTFEEVRIQKNEDDWMHCLLKEAYFDATCGLKNLPEAMKTFREWVIQERGREECCFSV